MSYCVFLSVLTILKNQNKVVNSNVEGSQIQPQCDTVADVYVCGMVLNGFH